MNPLQVKMESTENALSLFSYANTTLKLEANNSNDTFPLQKIGTLTQLKESQESGESKPANQFVNSIPHKVAKKQHNFVSSGTAKIESSSGTNIWKKRGQSEN